MKKFREIEANTLRLVGVGVDLLVFLSLVRSAPFMVQAAWHEVKGESASDKMKEREREREREREKKKKVFKGKNKVCL